VRDSMLLGSIKATATRASGFAARARTGSRRLAVCSLAVAAVLTLSAGGVHSGSQAAAPGLQPDGSTLLINGWTVTPAGDQLALATPDGTGGNLPLATALSPDGTLLAVLNGGAGVESLQLVDPLSLTILQTVPFAAPATVFQGLAFSPDGAHVYATGGGSNQIHAFDVANGRLTNQVDATVLLPSEDPKAKVYPMGLAVSPDGGTLWVVDNLANDVRPIDTSTLTPAGGITTGRYPYAALLSADGATLYVSNWDDGSVTVIDTASRLATGAIDVSTHPVAGYVFRDHPTAMALSPSGATLYVALANADAVAVVSTAANAATGFISLLPYPGAPYGASPQSLAIDAGGSHLYVANAGDNDVAVVDLASRQVTGLIPTAWYPTAVTLSAGGGRLWVASGKGLGAGPNDNGQFPNPTRRTRAEPSQFSGTMIAGTLSAVTLAGMDLAGLTAAVVQNDRFSTQMVAHPGAQPLPVQVGGASPIRHVIYIVKENRTYDQVFGDIKELGSGTDSDHRANGDPSLALFPRAVTPNQHALASQYVLFDNFYDDAEVSADGHNWSNGASASDYNERLWPQNYSVPDRLRDYDFEGDATPNLNAGGYLWDDAAAAGITYRNYGEWAIFNDRIENPDGSSSPNRVQDAAEPCPGPSTDRYTNPRITLQPGQVLCFGPQSVNGVVSPNLVGHNAEGFRHYDNSFPDVVRFDEWNAEFQQFVRHGNLPALITMRLPNDHTSGATAALPTPQALVADNDYALGLLVEAVSHSPYWQDTAIFVLEDDAQNGPDHVDAHRSTALVISPYNAHPGGFVDHSMYDTASMLRTIELILGLPPMSQFDAAATPMTAAFAATAGLSPYVAIAPDQALLAQRNPDGTAAAQISAGLDFSREDIADSATLNQVIWATVKGSKRMPSSVHNANRTQHSLRHDNDD